MNRRQLLKLGALGAVAPKAMVAPAQDRVIGIGMLQAVNPAAAVAWERYQLASAIRIVNVVTGTVTIEWSRDGESWAAGDYEFRQAETSVLP